MRIEPQANNHVKIILSNGDMFDLYDHDGKITMIPMGDTIRFIRKTTKGRGICFVMDIPTK